MPTPPSGPELRPQDALSHWDLPGTVVPLPDGGLINQTHIVGAPPVAVLQWLNPIFPPEVNADIDAVTAHLANQGLVTPRVLPTADNQLWLADPRRGCWRVLSWIPGVTLHRVQAPAQARAAGAVLGRFHAALHGWSAPRHAPVRRIHDTPARMAELIAALDSHRQHPLYDGVAALAAQVLEAWSRWPGRVDLPERTCHGDPKISNIRFDAAGRGLCMIDLDTVGPQTLDCELGDAWRSWCNPGGEDSLESVRVDLDRFTASAAGFFAEAPPLTPTERHALVPGLERICLELAARFARDALLNDYFREDRTRFPEVGTHNLHRARVQWRLGQDAAAQRDACTVALEAAAADAQADPH